MLFLFWRLEGKAITLPPILPLNLGGQSPGFLAILGPIPGSVPETETIEGTGGVLAGRHGGESALFAFQATELDCCQCGALVSAPGEGVELSAKLPAKF